MQTKIFGTRDNNDKSPQARRLRGQPPKSLYKNVVGTRQWISVKMMIFQCGVYSI